MLYIKRNFKLYTGIVKVVKCRRLWWGGYVWMGCGTTTTMDCRIL